MVGAKTSLDLLGLPSLEKADSASPTEERLKSISVTLLNILNHKKFDNPALRHLALDIESHHDADHETVFASGKENLIEALKSMTDRLPNYHAEFLDSGAKVSERTGKGTVWVLRRLTGLPDGLRRESVSVLNWEKREGEWYCTKHRGMRCAPCSDDLGETELQLDARETVTPDFEIWKL